MIASHDSATGERPQGVISYILTPFARTQSKTVVQQYESGCRYFDIRIRKSKNGFYACHGYWRCKTSVEMILQTISTLAECDKEKVFIMITYEGECDNEQWLTQAVFSMMQGKHLTLTEINVKKPVWRNIYKAVDAPPYKQCYKNLDGSSWHTYLPIPWLWNKIFRFERDNDKFNFLDFI